MCFFVLLVWGVSCMWIMRIDFCHLCLFFFMCVRAPIGYDSWAWVYINKKKNETETGLLYLFAFVDPQPTGPI